MINKTKRTDSLPWDFSLVLTLKKHLRRIHATLQFRVLPKQPHCAVAIVVGVSQVLRSHPREGLQLQAYTQWGAFFVREWGYQSNEREILTLKGKYTVLKYALIESACPFWLLVVRMDIQSRHKSTTNRQTDRLPMLFSPSNDSPHLHSTYHI